MIELATLDVVRADDVVPKPPDGGPSQTRIKVARAKPDSIWWPRASGRGGSIRLPVSRRLQGLERSGSARRGRRAARATYPPGDPGHTKAIAWRSERTGRLPSGLDTQLGRGTVVALTTTTEAELE